MVVPQRSEAQYGTFAGLTCSSQNIDLPKKQYEWDKSITWYYNGKYLHFKNQTSAIHIDNQFKGISDLQIKRVTTLTEGAYECHIMDKHNKKYIAIATVITKCPVNQFGRYCNESCDCVTGSSTSCDRYGGCHCKEGWNGTHCQHDLIPPVILRCPQDITQYTESGKAYTNVTWLVPAVEDNSDDVILFSNHNPSDIFQEGTTLVQYTAVDFSNNTDHCWFKIHVITKSALGLTLGISSACLFVLAIPVCVFLGYRYRHKLVKFFQDEDDYDWDGNFSSFKEQDAKPYSASINL
ncbi:uncharacterized protein [Ptychodera flava]|uniref:uncharacterized protein n=1 Tax=Ptychodera flava TaxID=63121 RepID=UPI00396A995B